ncbi:MAG TPA: hypothetical protein VFQ35_23865 [Polyangiaceae bacterium]|jgi:hypothetical protein|nr:hypothetical protein [Polyangiaceae bacterium]
MPISDLHINRLEQRAHDARVNADLAGDELAKLERTLDTRRRAKLAEIQALDDELEAARTHKTSLETEAQKLHDEWQANVPTETKE